MIEKKKTKHQSQYNVRILFSITADDSYSAIFFFGPASTSRHQKRNSTNRTSRSTAQVYQTSRIFFSCFVLCPSLLSRFARGRSNTAKHPKILDLSPGSIPHSFSLSLSLSLLSPLFLSLLGNKYQKTINTLDGKPASVSRPF